MLLSARPVKPVRRGRGETQGGVRRMIVILLYGPERPSEGHTCLNAMSVADDGAWQGRNDVFLNRLATHYKQNDAQVNVESPLALLKSQRRR